MNYRATLQKSILHRACALCKKSEHASAWGVSMNAQQERFEALFSISTETPHP